MRKFFLLFLLLPLLFSGSCGKGPSGKQWQIAIDPSWYPLNLMGRDKQMVGFATDLLQEMAVHNKIRILKVRENWDNLISNLQKKKYDAIFSSMEPYLFYEKQYDFSKPFVLTGPVLILPVGSKATSLKDLGGKEIAVIADSSAVLAAEKYPEIIIRSYGSIPDALNDILTGAVDGALIGVLEGAAYCQDLYKNQLQVVGQPLDDSGIRLVTLHNQAPELIEMFNATVAELKKSGKYAKLAEKWNLPNY